MGDPDYILGLSINPCRAQVLLNTNLSTPKLVGTDCFVMPLVRCRFRPQTTLLQRDVALKKSCLRFHIRASEVPQNCRGFSFWPTRRSRAFYSMRGFSRGSFVSFIVLLCQNYILTSNRKHVLGLVVQAIPEIARFGVLPRNSLGVTCGEAYGIESF